jgi:hypothetical protein
MSNVGATAGRKYYVLTSEAWSAYDNLPPSIRRVMQGMHLSYSAPDLLDAFRDGVRSTGSAPRATDALIDGAARSEAHEIANFSRGHETKHGAPLPHVAAGATICRPDSARRWRPITGPLRLDTTRRR